MSNTWIRTTDGGRYRACYRGQDGKTHSRTFSRKGDAKGWLATEQADIERNTWTDPDKAKVKFADFFEQFMAGSDIRPTTRDRYERHYRLYLAPSFSNRRIGTITPTEIRKWKTELSARGIGASTIVSALRLLKTAFNRAVSDELLARSPARNIENANVDPPGGMRVLEAEQVNALAAVVDDRYRALVLLLATKGLRIGEAAACTVGDIDLLRGRISVSKTLTEVAGRLALGPPKTAAGSRTVSLPPFLRDALTVHVATYSNPEDPSASVFTMAEGGPIRPNNFRKRVFSPAVKEAGLDPDLTPHDLRDTAATLALAAGASIKEVSNQLGHSNPAVTLNRYTGVLESMSARTDDALDAAFRAAPANPGGNAASLRPFARQATAGVSHEAS
jgi:integrase